MGSWLDARAKGTARRAAAAAPKTIGVATSTPGISRRTVLTRGAVVAGVAWTAPVLLSTRASAYGVSGCDTAHGSVICGTDTTKLQLCCPPATPVCYTDTNGNLSCKASDVSGGVCSNNGVGTCSDGTRCNGHNQSSTGSNQCNDCLDPHICGGEAASCDTTTGPACAAGLVCHAGICRRACTSDDGTHDSACSTAQICYQKFCAQPCGTGIGNGDKCSGPGGETCDPTNVTNLNICSYAGL